MNRTERAINRQLTAMAAPRFDLGVGLAGGGRKDFIIRDDLAPLEIYQSMGWLKHKNANGWHVFVRPAWPCGLVLLDDLNEASVKRLDADGLPPAALTETSPANFQAWVRLCDVGTRLSAPLMTAAARLLARVYAADMNSADHKHFGRLAGFTNRKSVYRRKNSTYPFVILHRYSGQVAPSGADILRDAKQALIANTPEKPRLQKVSLPTSAKNDTPGQLYQRIATSILMANQDKPWVNDPDYSRLDWMVSQNMVAMGKSSHEIADAILKGSPNVYDRHTGNGRAENYARHTAMKAAGELPPKDDPKPNANEL